MRLISLILLAILLMHAMVFGSCTKQPAASVRSAEPLSAEAIELVFAYWPPREAEIARLGWEVWGHELENATSGRVKVKFFGDAILGAPVAYYKLTRTGISDISVFVPEFTPGVFPFCSIANLPLVFPSAEAAALALYQFHIKYTASTELKDVKILAVSPTAPLQLLTNRVQVRTLEDLKGMKIAVTSPIVTKIVEKLGAAPVFIPEGHVYTSLQRGLVDGRLHQWDGAVVWKGMEVTTYRTGNVNLALDQMILAMNWNTWKKLPPDIQDIITGATGLQLSRHLGIVFDRANHRNLLWLQAYDRRLGNPEIYWLTDGERQRWAEAVQPFIEHWVVEFESQGYPARAALNDVRTWLERYKIIYEPGLPSLSN